MYVGNKLSQICWSGVTIDESEAPSIPNYLCLPTPWLGELCEGGSAQFVMQTHGPFICKCLNLKRASLGSF